MTENDCPESIKKCYYPYPVCDLNDKVCSRWSGFDCPVYDEFLKELKEIEEEVSGVHQTILSSPQKNT